MAAVIIPRDEQRMFEFKLEGSKKVYRIPLAAYLPYPFMRKMLTVDSDQSFALALLHEFCPELENDESVSFGTVNAIFEAWQEASRNDGVEAGESSASSEQ